MSQQSYLAFAGWSLATAARRFAALLAVAAITLLANPPADAGRSGHTHLTYVIIKRTHVEIYTQASQGDCSNSQRWHLMLDHPNFDALYSGLLSAKHAGTPVDIAGTGACYGLGEIVDWAYVAYP